MKYQRHIIDKNPLGDRFPTCTVGDLTGNGMVDMVIGSHTYPPRKYQPDNGDFLVWYEAPDWKRHQIDKGQFHMGSTVFDVTGNGLNDIVVSKDCHPSIWWYENTGKPKNRFKPHLVEDNLTRFIHDLSFADINNDGKPELLASASTGYLCYYTIPDDPTQPWQRHTVNHQVATEGLTAFDFNNDGRLDIIAGNFAFINPGPKVTAWPPWPGQKITPDFRNKCRVGVVRFNDGRQGVVLCEAEYTDGKISWFEYDTASDSWIEHKIGSDIYFGHSMTVADIDNDGNDEIFVGEMLHGGYGADPKKDARLMVYKCTDLEKQQWEPTVISEGEGIHEGHMVDLKGDGKYHVLGKEWRFKRVDWWEPV